MKNILGHMHFTSFATRMSIYVLSFTLIVFTAVMMLFYGYSRNKITDYAVEHTHGRLQNMATQIGSLLLTVETTMNQSAWMVEESLNNPDSLRRVISAIVKNNDLIVGSGIAFEPDFYKQKGKFYMPFAFLANDKLEYQILGGADYDYLCMDWYLIPKLLKQNYWSEPYYDEGGGNIIMSTYSMPLYDKKGEVYAVFTANISLAQFTDMVSQLKPYNSSFTFLLSRNGSFLTHRDRSKIMNETIFANAFEAKDKDMEYVGREMLAGHTGTANITLDNEPAYTFYTAIPNIGWSVGNVCPARVILTDLDTTSRQLVCLFLLGMLVLFFITNVIIRRLVHPLEEFSLSARAIATGRFDVKLPKIQTHDEMKDLHDSLAYMQNSLSAYVNELRTTTAAKERIESELSIAREIQMGMIPKIFPPFPERSDVDLHALLQPAKEVGGDLYDFFIDNGHLYFVLGDVSGKGIPASLFMAITRSLFRTLSSDVLSPGAIVTAMNNSISENNESNMFVTLIVGILDLHTGLLKLCNAGHNPPVQILPDGDVCFMELHKNLFVGIMQDYVYEEDEFMLEKDTKLFLYTDGVTEAENLYKELFGDSRLLETISINTNADVRKLVDSVVCSVEAHVQEADQSDDMTILVVHYEPEISPKSTPL